MKPNNSAPASDRPIPRGTFSGSDSVPPGTFHGSDSALPGTFHQN